MTETEIFNLFQEFHINIKSHHHLSSEICNMDISNWRKIKISRNKCCTNYSFSQVNFDSSQFIHGI